MPNNIIQFTKSLVLFLIGIILSIFLGSRGLNGQSDPLPVGSDEFGYLHLAESIRNGTVFREHTERPFLPQLLSFLDAQGISKSRLTTVLGPLAYHLRDDKLINQYPPGTSFILSFLPKEVAKGEFGGVVAALSFVIILTSLMLIGLSVFESIGGALIVISILVFVPPWKIEFERINSLAPTFGMLIGAGILAKSRPLIATALLSASVLFRVANVVIVAAFVCWQLFHFRNKADLFNRAVRLFFIVLISGLGFYLLYVWRLIGSPFSPTYADVDTTFTAITKIPKYISYYLNLNKSWFLVHLILIWGQTPFSLGLFVTVANYAFFITHKVRLVYYPYASANFLLGLVIANVASRNGLRPIIKIGWLTAPILLLWIGIPQLPESANYHKAASVYSIINSEADVVWAELETGRIEYTTGVPTLRYPAADEEVRRLVISWLAKNNYRQAFVANDRGMTPAIVEGDLKSLGLEYINRESRFGRLFIVGNA